MEKVNYFLKSKAKIIKPCFVEVAMRPGAPGCRAKDHHDTGIGSWNTRIDRALVVGRKETVRPNMGLGG